MDNSKQVIIFYSWQSDLPQTTNRNAIRQALRTAINQVEDALKDTYISIMLDEATRNVPGSPNIPKTILEKIEVSDIFVADVSIINSGSDEGRRFPNPNVVFELGYAVAHLGWNRVIMLVNTEFGSMNELPFDFDRHRASAYKLNENSSKNDQKRLAALLKDAVEFVIIWDPHRPAALKAASPEEIKRHRDIGNIRWALSNLHLPTLDQHIMDSPHSLRTQVLYFWEGFNELMLNSLFHLYDDELENEFRRLHTAWWDSIRFDQHYYSNSSGSVYIFGNFGDTPLSDEEQEAWGTIKQANRLIRQSLVVQPISFDGFCPSKKTVKTILSNY